MPLNTHTHTPLTNPVNHLIYSSHRALCSDEGESSWCPSGMPPQGLGSPAHSYVSAPGPGLPPSVSVSGPDSAVGSPGPQVAVTSILSMPASQTCVCVCACACACGCACACVPAPVCAVCACVCVYNCLLACKYLVLHRTGAQRYTSNSFEMFGRMVIFIIIIADHQRDYFIIVLL